MNEDKKYWLDDPRNVNKFVFTLYAVCIVLLGADLLDHKHSHFDFEEVFGFFGLFGFVAFVGLDLAAKVLRKLLKREEDYYDRSD